MLIPKLLQRAVLAWWSFAALLATIALFVFPFMKGLPLGLIPVVFGVSAALGVRKLPKRWLRQVERVVFGGDSGRWLAVVCVLGFIVRLPGIIFPAVPFDDPLAYLLAAKSLAAGHGYPGVLYPPGQAAWLAIWIAGFGPNLHVLAFAQTLVGVSAPALLYVSVRPWSFVAARLAALIAAFFPSLVLASGALGHETTDVLLQIIILAIYLAGVRSVRRRTGAVIWIILGLASGAAALLRPTFLVMPTLVALNLWFLQVGFRRCLAAALLVLASMAAVVAPWSLRNYRQYGSICLVSANFGKILLSANQMGSLGVYSDISRYISGEPNPVRQDKIALNAAERIIVAHPGRFLRLSAQRIVFMWGTDTSMLEFVLGLPPRGGYATKASFSAAIQFAWAWLVCAWCIAALRQRRSGMGGALQMWCVTSVGVIWASHCVLEALSRHHLTIIPLIAVAAMPRYWQWICGSFDADREEHALRLASSAASEAPASDVSQTSVSCI